MRRPVPALLAALFACTGSAADHEELGDRNYAAGAYHDALAEYQLGLRANPGNAGLHAKAAAAAVHTETYSLAAAEYTALGREDRSRADEAADGLERVVRAALAVGDRVAVAIGLAGLRDLAPTRPLGRYAHLVALDALEQGNLNDALALLPTAVAAAPDARRADSLLYLYGIAAVRARDCATAVPVFDGVIRRQREPAVSDGAREGVALCALVEGQQALDRGQPGTAEEWFRRAAAPGASVDVMRAAYLGLGDVRLAQGDVVGALANYQESLASGTPGDSLYQRAREKINALGRATDGPVDRP